MTKILLVEDDKSLREIYGVRLLAEGYDIVSAGDGEEALAMAIKDRPALIVSDVMMPKISGFDMLDILRSTTETKDIKIIMMTALSSEDQRKRGEQLGADRYLVKSQVGIEDVVRTVHDVLGDSPVPSSTPFGSSSPVPPTPTAEKPAAPAAPLPPAPSATPGTRPTPPSATVPPRPAADPVAPASVPEPTTGLPQPTAPFSTPRPGTGNGLADRVIQPISQSDPNDEPPVADLMAKALSEDSAAPATPSAPASEAPAADSSVPAPQATPTPEPTPSPQPSNPIPPPTPPQAPTV